ncbi:Lsr2 family protein [Nocardia sp. CS682]|uniref:histone-like nucleoid-structuring protein Lsr2 n=1 Tax=Nocardia sp. CS682 TaxID=1047172 RepID=UPI0010750D96|nr:nucleoid-associated protein Lsr2 [Nocardia sp. CS682]
MARHIIEALIDDVDGSEADETVLFGFDGRLYEIDLSYANANKLRAAVDPWVDKARKTGRASSRSGNSRTRTTSGTSEVAAIRTWANENGHRVSSRGRIPSDVVAAYRAAQAAPQGAAPSRSKPAVPAFVEPTKKRAKKEAKKAAKTRS